MKRSTLIALVVFAGLVALAVVKLSEKKERGIERVSLAQVDATKLDRIELSGKNTAALVKEGDVWKYEGRKADEAAIKQLLEAIGKLESSELVTKSKDKFEELEVTDEKGTRVKVSAGGTVQAEFVVGKAAAGGSNVLVDGAVYVAKDVRGYVFQKSGSNWLEKKLFTWALKDVTKLEVQLAGQPAYALVKAEGDEWKLADESALPKGFRFDKAAARTLVSNLVNARAKDILDTKPDEATSGLADTADKLVVTAGETTETLWLGKETEDKSVHAKVSSRPPEDVFTFASYTAKNLKKNLVDLRDLGLMSFDKDKVVSVTIRDGKKSVTFDKQGAGWKIANSTDPVPKDFEFDESKVTRRITAIASLKGIAIAPAAERAKAKVASPDAQVGMKLEDGTKVTLSFGAKTKHEDRDAVYATGNADGELYLVTEWVRKNNVGLIDTFKKDDPAAGGHDGLSNLDPKALKGLPPDVQKSLEQQISQKKKEQDMIKRVQEQMAKQGGGSP